MKMRPSTRLRELLAENRILVKPGAFNALSALIIEKQGFKVMGLSGYSVSASLLGKPDIGLITMDEIVTVARYITSATSIPVLADADTGFGNAINAMRTTEEFIGAGVAGIHIEDQFAPKRCGHVSGKQLVPIEEAAGKFRACAKVRDDTDPDFLIVARSDARGVAGGTIEDVVRRGNAYAEAGADMFFPDALVSEEEVEQVCKEVPLPIHFNRTGVSPMASKERLQEMGVAMVSNASGALRAAMRAMWNYAESFAERDVDFVLEFLDEGKEHPTGDLHGFMGFPEIRALEEEFLPSEDVIARYEGSIGYEL